MEPFAVVFQQNNLIGKGTHEVAGVGEGLDEGSHHLRHLRRVHDGVPGRLLLRQLVDHHGGLRHDHLVLVVQKLDQFRNCSSGQIGVILKSNTN